MSASDTTCQDCIDLMLDFVEGDLPEDVRLKLEEHLGGCQPCEDFLSTYRVTPSVCRRAMVRDMPESVSLKLHQFLREELGREHKG